MKIKTRLQSDGFDSEGRDLECFTEETLKEATFFFSHIYLARVSRLMSKSFGFCASVSGKFPEMTKCCQLFHLAVADLGQ